MIAMGGRRLLARCRSGPIVRPCVISTIERLIASRYHGEGPDDVEQRARRTPSTMPPKKPRDKAEDRRDQAGDQCRRGPDQQGVPSAVEQARHDVTTLVVDPEEVVVEIPGRPDRGNPEAEPGRRVLHDRHDGRVETPDESPSSSASSSRRPTASTGWCRSSSTTPGPTGACSQPLDLNDVVRKTVHLSASAPPTARARRPRCRDQVAARRASRPCAATPSSCARCSSTSRSTRSRPCPRAAASPSRRPSAAGAAARPKRWSRSVSATSAPASPGRIKNLFIPFFTTKEKTASASPSASASFKTTAAHRGAQPRERRIDLHRRPARGFLASPCWALRLFGSSALRDPRLFESPHDTTFAPCRVVSKKRSDRRTSCRESKRR